MEELIGQTLNRYKIASLLGEGGMGAVFKAHDVTLQRDVAIKVMHPQFARQPNFRERFLQEARTAARLSHSGVVKVYDFGQYKSSLYIVMEFLPGDNLQEMLNVLRKEKKWLVLEESVELVRHIALALDYAHEQGVLHRDIKPANVMLKPEPVGTLPYSPVLTDLGLARLLGSAGLTQEGTSMGTPAYMSPEQAAGTETDARSDVYSLGILLYELSVGRPPFLVRTLTEAIRYHTKEAPPSPRDFRPDLPDSLERIIMKCLEKNRELRYAHAEELAVALESALSDVTAAVTEMPTPLQGAMSLMTQYQQSIVSQRGNSVLQEFDAPSDVSADRIQIMGPDKSTKSVAMQGTEMTVGRGSENDITLDSSKVSRGHAKITFDGAQYQIIDMNSTNGTFLGNTKLLPGVPELWTPEKSLRIGDFYLRLTRPERSGTEFEGTAIYKSDGTMVDPTSIRTSVGEGRNRGLCREPQPEYCPRANRPADGDPAEPGGPGGSFPGCGRGDPDRMAAKLAASGTADARQPGTDSPAHPGPTFTGKQGRRVRVDCPGHEPGQPGRGVDCKKYAYGRTVLKIYDPGPPTKGPHR